MAVYQSPNVSMNYPKAVHGDAVETQRAYAEVSVTAGLVAFDSLQLCYLPVHARIIGAAVSADQLDTNGTPTLTFNVGDLGWSGYDGVVAADPARYFSAITVGRTATGTDANSNGTVNGRARFLRNSSAAPVLIYASVPAGAATGAAGKFRFELTYFIDEPRSNLF